MFNFNKKNTVVESAEKFIPVPEKSVNEIIEEIHESFYTEVDRLLASAKISNCLDTDKQLLIDKRNRLVSLGFTNTKEVKDAESEINRLANLIEENNNKESLIKAIDYFSFKYPLHKFITADSVKKICDKYNLVYGDIKNYIGTVPDKNLKQIEEFKIDQEDELYIELIYNNSMITTLTHRRFISHKEFIKKSIPNQHQSIVHFSKSKCNLEIAAPIKDFDIKNMQVKDFKLSKIEIPDPVVLKPVFFNDKKYYLIVTAWGQEAADELVVNQKMN